MLTDVNLFPSELCNSHYIIQSNPFTVNTVAQKIGLCKSTERDESRSSHKMTLTKSWGIMSNTPYSHHVSVSINNGTSLKILLALKKKSMDRFTHPWPTNLFPWSFKTQHQKSQNGLF